MIGPASAHAVFGHQGQWYQPEGTAVVPILPGQVMQRGLEHVVSFSIDNVDELAREAAAVYVSASGKNLVFDELLAGDQQPLSFPGSAPGDAQPLKLYTNAWSLAQIGQDNPFPLASNTIHVTLASWQGLSAGTVIDVEGLLGSTTASGTLVITEYNEGPQVFASTGSWVSGNGQLSVTTVSFANASTIYRFSFNLDNMQWENSAPTVSIEARGGRYPISKRWPIRAGNVLNPAFASIPFLSEAEAAALRILPTEFYLKRCSQSTAYPSRWVSTLVPRCVEGPRSSRQLASKSGSCAGGASRAAAACFDTFPCSEIESDLATSSATTP